MEVELPFTLTYHTKPAQTLRCAFPPEPSCALERLLLCDTSAPESAVHDIEIMAYTVWVRFENAFNTQRMLDQATYQSSEQHHESKVHKPFHTILLVKNARLFYMAARSAVQLEHQLEVMKLYLLPGTFDDDESDRVCMGITSIVRQTRQLDMEGMRRALCMTQDADEPYWCATHSLARLMQMAAMTQRDLDCFEVDPQDDLDFDNLGAMEDDGDDCKVCICLLPQRSVLLSLEGGDRQSFVVAHCALHRIMSRHYYSGSPKQPDFYCASWRTTTTQ